MWTAFAEFWLDSELQGDDLHRIAHVALSSGYSVAELRDIYLYDCQTQKLLPTPGLNSKREDFDPCIIVLE